MRVFKNIFKSILLVFSSLLLTGCNNENKKTVQFREETKFAAVKQKDTVIVPIKDSIDICIEKRTTIKLKGSIFAHINFTDSPSTIKWKLKKYSQEYKNSIYVKNNRETFKFKIDKITPIYYKKELYKLVLNSNNTNLIEYLKLLYEIKYGPTKNWKWNYNNISIFVGLKYRMSAPSSTYGQSNFYYNTFENDKGNGTSITTESTYSEISYTNLIIKKEIIKDKATQDSLQIAKEKRKEEEKKKSDFSKSINQIKLI